MSQLPPGQSGLPLLGEALTLARDPFAYVRDRAAEHGRVARSRVLKQDVALLSGPDTVEAFLDEANVRRAGGLPPHASELFGGGSVNQLDGDAHRRRKAHMMRAVDAPALAHYLPQMRRLLRARLTAWRAAGEVRLQDEGQRASMALTLANFASIEADDALLTRCIRGYSDFGAALVGLPLALPGTPLARAQAFTREMRARFSELAEARRTQGNGDALSRLVASEVDGERLSTEDIAKETHHLIFAASGLWCWMGQATLELARDPALAARLREATAALGEDCGGRAYVEAPGLSDFVREVKRTGSLIPFTAFGVARRDFEVGGYTVPKGWLVTWTTTASHQVPGVAPYADPQRFHPDRFARGEGAAPHHFAPQGPGEAHTSHRCAGVEYSSLALQVFAAELLNSGPFSLPPQDLSLSGELPARWKDGLRVKFG